MCVVIGDDYTAFREGGGVSTHFHVLCNETKIDIDCSIYTLDENHLFLCNILTLRQKKEHYNFTSPPPLFRQQQQQNTLKETNNKNQPKNLNPYVLNNFVFDFR